MDMFSLITKTEKEIKTMEDFFNSLFKDSITGDIESYVVEKSYGWTIEFILPGYKKDDIKIELYGNSITISSEIKDENKFSKRIKSFSKSYKLPPNTDFSNIKAKLEDGILKIDIYKTDAEKIEKKVIEIE